MEYIIIIILLLLFLLMLKIGLNIKIKDIKRLKQLSQDTQLNNIINMFPKNKEICEEILETLNNKNVKIEELSIEEKSQTSLYLVLKNKILIANIEKNCTRIQTIAHECIHSVQNKKILKFNFFISNINILYFIISCILAILNLSNLNFLLIILILIQLVSFVVRSYLETDAMIRAEYIAKDYIKSKKILKNDDEQKVINTYKEVNKIGIKLYNYIIITKKVFSIIIFLLIAMI